jgi:hypothetical protein
MQAVPLTFKLQTQNAEMSASTSAMNAIWRLQKL